MKEHAETTGIPADSMAFQIMAKPIGPICNLDCAYCFYLEKERLFPDGERFRMSEEILERFVCSYIEAQEAPEIHFAWQGGEPTLMGVDFFRKAVEFQKKYANGKSVHNQFQTNGVLLNAEWCEFLAEHRFLIGISIDGPRELHDAYRLDKRRQPTFDRVMHGLESLKKHTVEFNTLTVVNRKNSQEALKVYRFLKDIGSRFMQFIPLVERKPDAKAAALGMDLAGPPDLQHFQEEASPVMPWSVGSKQYGVFLTEIFEEWVRRDVGRTYVTLFDNALAQWAGFWATFCVFQERCGKAMIVEHNGDVYSCDHFVYPDYRIGNVMEQPLREIVVSARQVKFGNDKYDRLPQYCLDCPVRFACNGECPKHRFIRTPDGQPGLNYLCAGYKHFFTSIDPYMRTMAQLLAQRRPPALIMELLAREPGASPGREIRAKERCPCGSGKQYRKCCGRKA